MPKFDDSLEAPVVISANNISKKFVLRRDNSVKDRLLSFRSGRQNREEFIALDDVSVEVRAGQTIALIGHNGSGKSTLLKVIGGILDPTSGSVSRRGRLAALLELGAGFHPDLSGRDNVFLNASLLGLSRTATEAVFDDIVAFAELEEFIDTQVKFYSSGMYVRLAFAVAIHTNPDVLLVDEVLAVGDEAFQRKCMDTIRRFQSEGRTILLVTHNLNQVLELADSAVLLHHGKLVFTGEPRIAIAQFRDLLEENRLEHALGGTRPNGKVRNVDVTWLVDGKNTSDHVEVGDDLQINIKVDGELDSKGWFLSVLISDPMGFNVSGSANDLLDIELEAFSGEANFRFTITNTRFGEGKYFITVSVINDEGEHLFDAIQATSFNAEAPVTSRGALSMNYELTRN